MDKKVIGKRIRYQREKLSLTRDEFAERIEISPQFLAEIENGTKGMSAETLFKICDRLNLSADYMLLGRQSSVVLQTPGIEMLSKVPPKHTEAIETIMQAFLTAVEVDAGDNM